MMRETDLVDLTDLETQWAAEDQMEWVEIFEVIKGFFWRIVKAHSTL